MHFAQLNIPYYKKYTNVDFSIVFSFSVFFLPIRLNLRGGHQTGFGIQVQMGGSGG